MRTAKLTAHRFHTLPFVSDCAASENESVKVSLRASAKQPRAFLQREEVVPIVFSMTRQSRRVRDDGQKRLNYFIS